MSTNIIIVGVGALGSHVVQLIRNLEADITVVDFDRVEQKNASSQFHGKPHVGKLKVEALNQSMNLLWGRRLTVRPTKLTEANTLELLGAGDKKSLVIDCLDNGVARRLVQGHVRKHGIPCLHGALAANGGFGRVVWDESFVIDDEAGEGGATCEDGEHLPFIGVVSAYIAKAASDWMKTGKKHGFSISPGGVIGI